MKEVANEKKQIKQLNYSQRYLKILTSGIIFFYFLTV